MRNKPRPHNDGKWTEARMRSFIMSALRKAQWGVKYIAIRKAYIHHGVDPETGRACKLHECASCLKLFPASKMQADHIEPVVPLDGDWGTKPSTWWLGVDWNALLPRMFCEADNFQALCADCHKRKSAGEAAKRAEYKRKAREQNELF